MKWQIICCPCHHHILNKKTTSSTKLLLLVTTLLHKFTVIIFHFVDIVILSLITTNTQDITLSLSQTVYSHTHMVSQNKLQHDIICLITYILHNQFPFSFLTCPISTFVFSSFGTYTTKTNFAQFLYQCSHNQEIKK